MNQQSPASAPGLPPRIYEYVLAGLLLAAGAGAVLGYHVHHGFVTEEIARDRAYWGIGVPFAAIALGIYIFSYGWQRGEVEKALLMSIWLSLGLLAVITVVIGMLALKRSPRPRWLSIPTFSGRTPGRRSRWHFGAGDVYEEYSDPRPIFARTSGRGGGIEVHCTRCGELFIPRAPGAYCPRCGHSAVGRPPAARTRAR